MAILSLFHLQTVIYRAYNAPSKKKTQLVSCFQGSQSYQGGKEEVNSWQAQEPQDLLETSRREKRGIHPNLKVLQAKSNDESLALCPSLEKLLKVHSETTFEKFQQGRFQKSLYG